MIRVCGGVLASSASCQAALSGQVLADRVGQHLVVQDRALGFVQSGEPKAHRPGHLAAQQAHLRPAASPRCVAVAPAPRCGWRRCGRTPDRSPDRPDRAPPGRDPGRRDGPAARTHCAPGRESARRTGRRCSLRGYGAAVGANLAAWESIAGSGARRGPRRCAAGSPKRTVATAARTVDRFGPGNSGALPPKKHYVDTGQRRATFSPRCTRAKKKPPTRETGHWPPSHLSGAAAPAGIGTSGRAARLGRWPARLPGFHRAVPSTPRDKSASDYAIM